MRIEPFGVEIWMNAQETRCAYNLGETCVASITIGELLTMAGLDPAALTDLLPMKMTYGAIEGSERLRSAIAALYERQGIENVLVAHGAIGANALVYHSLVGPGDRVVSITPTYQQHYSIPESIGADVRRLPLRPENGFLPDLDALRDAVGDKAVLIAMTNPNNPTGALMDRAMLEEIAAIARAAGAWVLSDEVYRGTDDQDPGLTVSMADLYEKGISTGSMSKAFSLAGLRLGWIAAPRPVIEAAMIHRDYNTISVGMLDDHFASIALEHAEAIYARSRRIVRGNRKILDAWIADEPRVSWVRPQSGTIALLNYGGDEPSDSFCRALIDETGVLLTPGSALEIEGCARIGYANSPEILTEGLARLSGFLRKRAA